MIKKHAQSRVESRLKIYSQIEMVTLESLEADDNPVIGAICGDEPLSPEPQVRATSFQQSRKGKCTEDRCQLQREVINEAF